MVIFYHLIYYTMYTCEICDKTFCNKQVYGRHKITKSHREREQNNSSLFVCKCRKSFKYDSGLSRHKKKCKYIEPVYDPQSDYVIQHLQEQLYKKDQEMKMLRKQVECLMEKSFGNTTNNHTTTNSNNKIDNGTHFNITVNSFGNENIDYLSDKLVCRLIQSAPFTSIPKIIERIHFDPDHPENHNIKVTNKKLNYAEIVKDNKWVTTNKKHAIEAMIQNGYDLLDEKYQDNKESISDFKQERFEDFQQKFQEEDKELVRTIKDEVDIALLNGTGDIHK
jgi:hypothetical protein